MDSIPAQTDTPISDPVFSALSAYEISLIQDTSIFGHLKGQDNLKAGDTCPQCQIAKMDYDCMLNLHCSNCGYTLAGCST
jgi:hypothetical protein